MAADASSFPGQGPGTKTSSSPAVAGTAPDGGDCGWDCGGMSPDVSPVATSASNEWWWKEESPVSFRFSLRNWSDRVENFSDLDIPSPPPLPAVSSESTDSHCRGRDVQFTLMREIRANPPERLSTHAPRSMGCFRCALSQSPMMTCQTRITFSTNRRLAENPRRAPECLVSISCEFCPGFCMCSNLRGMQSSMIRRCLLGLPAVGYRSPDDLRKRFCLKTSRFTRCLCSQTQRPLVSARCSKKPA